MAIVGIAATAAARPVPTAVKHEHRAIAVMLDFMDPAIPLRKLIRKCWKLWLNEAKARTRDIGDF